MSEATVGLMTAGNFRVDLDPSTPRSIVEGLPTFSTIHVTPGRCSGLTRTELLEFSRFTGVLRSRSDDLCSLSGPSNLVFLGDEDGKGPHVTETVVGTFGGTNMLLDLFSPASNVNGLTLGSTSTLPGTAIYAALNSDGPETPRQFLDRVCRALDWEYRCKPNGEVDVEEAGSLFRSTPEVLILADHLGDPVSDVGRLVLSGQIRATAHDDDYATEVEVTDGTYTGSAVTLGTPPNDFTTAATAEWWKQVSGSGYSSDSDAATQAGYEVLNNYATKNLVDVSVRLEDPWARIEPGDLVHVYDPLQGLYDMTNQLLVMGGPVFPLQLHVTEMTAPFTDGLGLYACLNTTGAVWDLSEYVLWGTGSTSLKVGARWPTIDEVVNRRN